MSSSDIFNDDEIERLRTESAAFEQAWKDACARAEKTAEELAAVKALLREALPWISGWTDAQQLYLRIRAALGDEPADDAPRKQP